MKTSFVLTLATFLSAAIALPTANGGGGGGGSTTPPSVFKCPSTLLSNPQCCATDVLGVADLNCASPPSTPTSKENFVDVCASIGQIATCCLIPLLGQDVVCQQP